MKPLDPKLWGVLMGTVLFGMAQQQPERRLPPGHSCAPYNNIDRGIHACTCKRVVDDPTCEGSPTEQPVCKSFCAPDACKCPIVCTGEPHER